MAQHRLLTAPGWSWAARLISSALGLCLGSALAASCSTDDAECSGSGPIELGAFSVTKAQSDNAELDALLTGPEPATISVSLDQLRIEYRRNGVPVSVLYDVVRKYE
jgi:cellobiose-specific phosphotransferase system component IIB